VKRKKGGLLRFVAIADPHHRYSPGPVLPEGDVLVCAGDACMFGDMVEFNRFIVWWENLPYKHKIFVPGNHDRIVEQDVALCKNWLLGTHLLVDDMVEIEGIKIYGSPYTPEFCNWAFMLTHQEELEDKWSRIPERIDILVTHGPPRGILDEAGWELVDGVWTDRHVGCIELRKAIERVKPLYHIFGHIHSQGGKTKTVAGTQFINASLCNERYEHTNLPIEFCFSK